MKAETLESLCIARKDRFVRGDQGPQFCRVIISREMVEAVEKNQGPQE